MKQIKVLSLLLCTALAAGSFTACGNTDDDDDEKPVTKAFSLSSTAAAGSGESTAEEDSSGEEPADTTTTAATTAPQTEESKPDTPSGEKPLGNFKYFTSYESGEEVFISFSAPEIIQMNFKSDGTLTFSYGGEVEPLVWDDEYIYFDDDKDTYTYDGSKLTIDEGDQTIVMLSEEAYDSYDFIGSIYYYKAQDAAKDIFTAISSELADLIADGDPYPTGKFTLTIESYDSSDDIQSAIGDVLEDYNVILDVEVNYEITSTGYVESVTFECNGFRGTYPR